MAPGEQARAEDAVIVAVRSTPHVAAQRPVFSMIVAAVLAATIIVPGRTSSAQGAPATSPVTPTAPAEPPAGPRSSAQFTVGSRGYTVGSSQASEATGGVSYEYRTSRWGLSLDGASVRYEALGRTISGLGGTNVRFEYTLRPGDTLTVYARSASSPRTLDSLQVDALGVTGGSLVDMQASGLGSAPLYGARASFALPVGDLVLNLRGGLEIESKPDLAQSMYWRGTTWMLGSTLYGNVGKGTLAGSLDIESSTADSLGGRNLYPGGGLATARVELHLPIANPADSTGDDWDSALSAFLSSPFGATRADQPNRMLPLGNTVGVSGSLSFPVGDASWGPNIDFVHTSATASATSGTTAITSASSGWAANFSLVADIPTSKVFDVMPEIGYSIGNASTSYGATSSKTVTVKRRGRTVTTTSGSRTSDAVSGWWIAVGISAHF